MSITPIFRGTIGLNTVLTPQRIPYDSESGVMALSAAVNVVVDDSGRITSRDGYAEVDDQPWHSLFCDGGECVGVRDGDLCVIAEDLSHAVIRSGLNSRVSYAQVNTDIYYTSPDGFGIVRDGQHVDWVAGAYVGPETDKSLVGPFAANHIAFHAGRMWLALDNFIAFSEPFAWSWFDLHGGTIPLSSRVTMMKPVLGGMYISTDRRTFFLSGSNPEEFTLSMVADYPAIEWSVATEYVDGMEVGLEEPGFCAFWASTKGACLGTARGTVINLTRDKIIYPEAGMSGAGLIRGYNFIHTIGG